MAKTFTTAYNNAPTAADNLTGQEIIGYDPATGAVSRGAKLDQLKVWLGGSFDTIGSAAAVQANLDNHAGDPLIHIVDAPADNGEYARKNNGWVLVTGGTGGGIPEAPIDGVLYGRINGAWAAATPAAHETNTNNPHSVTAAQAGADPAGTAAASMTAHEGAADPHPQYSNAGKMDLVPPDTAGDAMILDATGQGVKAGVPLAAIDLTEVNAALPAGANAATSSAHGMPGWTLFNTVLVSTGTGAFSAGDELPVPVFSGYGGSSTSQTTGFTVSVDADDIIVRNTDLGTGDPPVIFDPQGTPLPLIAANFTLKVTFITFTTVTLP